MKSAWITILICGLLTATAQQGWARKWTDSTGKFSVEAEFVKVEGQKVTLKKTNGSLVTLPIKRLSVADRKYLQSLQLENGVDRAAGPLIDGPKASGKIKGREFIPDRAELEQDGAILKLRQGEDLLPDLAVIIFLFLDEGATPAGRSFDVKATSPAGTMSPHIHVQWREADKGTPETQIVMNGYEMKLQFGSINKGILPGKIDLRIPGEAGTTVAGTFEVAMSDE